MKVEALQELPEVKLIDPDVYGDARGFFLETWRHERYATAGLDVVFVQDNHSRSAAGVVRGLHFQHPTPQAKLLYVVRGAILDVVVDVRVDSPRFGHWAAAELSAADHRQIFVPEGFAHGFAVLGEDAAEVVYKCSAPWRSEQDRVLVWNDPAVGVEWPMEDPVVSERDAAGRSLDELRRAGVLPVWRE